LPTDLLDNPLLFQYGSVFGTASLAGFLSSPIFGKYGEKIGPRRVYNVLGFVAGTMGILFGTLTYVKETTWFLALSYLLR
jgi:MFS family permease